MAVRLKAMKKVLKPTGSIYLHCDPTASHYLKLVMDAVFGSAQFKNEIVWGYRTGGVSKKRWARKHDILFFYSASSKYQHNAMQERVYYEKPFFNDNVDESGRYFADVYIRDVWEDIKPLINVSKERLGYPTQKPRALLERIIEASSRTGDIILDPFCGCGTAPHAAERLGRQWIGCDISDFAAGLVRNRLIQKSNLSRDDISILGSPRSIKEARDLAKKDKFEFEKWICGEIGAEGMYHNPGSKGADAGVDGIIPFYHAEQFGSKVEPAMAIVQVKGGKVLADSVRALSTVVRQHQKHGVPAKCGVFVCFDRYMNTVNNNRERGKIKDFALGEFDFIQSISVEDLLKGKRPRLPVFYDKAA